MASFGSSMYLSTNLMPASLVPNEKTRPHFETKWLYRFDLRICVNVKTAAKPAPRHIDLTYCMLSQQPNMLIQEGTNTLYAANDVNKTAPLSLMLLLNNVINILFYRGRVLY